VPPSQSNVIGRLNIAALLTCVLLLLPSVSAFAQPRARARRRPAVSSRAGGPLIKPADIFDAMYFKERADSDLTPAALAAYGNSLVARRGLDFGVDACALMEANRNAPRAPVVSESARVFAYTMRRVGGGLVRFRLITDMFDEQPDRNCGECHFAVPALRVTRSEMLVVAGGRRYRLERPDVFLLGEASLMDASLKTVRRAWQLPYQAEPLGLSADRTRLYLPLPEFDDVTWDDKLALELSDAGIKFVVRERLRLTKGERLTSPAEIAEADATFMRFGAGPQAYVIRINAPCT
jgi:hypothetical protein